MALKNDQLLPRHNRKFHQEFAKIKLIVNHRVTWNLGCLCDITDVTMQLKFMYLGSGVFSLDMELFGFVIEFHLKYPFYFNIL